ncbi:hypothetical protein VTL71DRAFT_11526 [Oculimacula yallundae]|uniref:Uncharacterized protein n=1 Tax=Oculimacula yallundae TaxID=86028 RepID=A0ABR4CQB7_9HELO
MMFDVFGNSSANHTVHWQPEPTTRGTFGILSTCLITISLCIWTSLHLNVPGSNEKSSRQLWRKGKWLIGGLLAPEFVLFTALYQYILAKQTAELVSKELSKHSRRNPTDTAMQTGNATEEQNLEDPEQGSPRQYINSIKFTIKQGFFIQMGGLAFDVKGAKGVYIPSDVPDYWFPNFTAIRNLCQLHPEIFDTVTDRSINDKSKTGNFGKTLVCLQASWFIAQCISRLAQRLPISLLELNTLGHCVCALLVYCFWWSKPLDVEQPILIQEANHRETLAWMWMYSHPADGPGNIEEIHHVWPFSHDESHGSLELARDLSAVQLPEATHQTSPESPAIAQTILESGQALPGTNMKYRRLCGPDHLHLSAIDVLRWQLASARAQTLDVSQSRGFWSDQRIVSRCKNGFQFTGLSPRDRLLAWSILVLASIIYGGLHALAWYVTFGSHTERFLWRLSASSVMSYGFVATVYLFLDEFYEALDLFSIIVPSDSSSMRENFFNVQRRLLETLGLEKYLFSKNPIIRWCSKLQAGLLVLVCCVARILFLWATFFGSFLYLAARVYLVVECFISLFRSPPDLYEKPVWASYFPHIR